MAPPIQVAFRHFTPTDAIRTKIESLLKQFDPFEDSIVFGEVVVDATGKKGDKTELEIRIQLDLPGGTAVAKRSADVPAPAGQRSFDSAATEAFRVAIGQVKAHLDKMRPHETKQLDHQPERGRIETLNAAEKNGFIEMPGGVSLFFSEDVVEGDFDQFGVGDEVLVITAGTDSTYGPQASFVKPLGPISAKG